MLELRFPLPNRPLSINELGGPKGWQLRRARLAPWREEIAGTWMVCKDKPLVKGKPCLVHVTIPFDVSPKQFAGTRRDPHNYTGTIVKALIDELVKVGVWPDDTPEWVTTIEPTLARGKEVVVRLIPRDADNLGEQILTAMRGDGPDALFAAA